MKNLLRATVLTLVTAGIVSAAVVPNAVKAVSTNASPIPMCDPGSPKCELFPNAKPEPKKQTQASPIPMCDPGSPKCELFPN